MSETPAKKGTQAPAAPTTPKELEGFLDVPVRVSVELGRSTIKVGEVAHLERGTVIELNRVTGEANDIVIDEHAIGKGEVVVTDESLACRVTKISAEAQSLS